MKTSLLVLAVILISLGANAQTDSARKSTAAANVSKPSSGNNARNAAALSPNAHNDNYQNYDKDGNGTKVKFSKKDSAAAKSEKAPAKKQPAKKPNTPNKSTRADSTSNKTPKQ